MLEEQKNNPLHGVKLEALVTELVEHYGFEVLASEMNLNCFKSNPSIKSTLKFLRKTDWAREKVEGFYLYKYKRLPRPHASQDDVPPRDRTIPLDQKPRSPAVITPRTGQEKKNTRSAKTADWRPAKSGQPRTAKKPPEKTAGNVWGNWGKKDQ